MREKTIAFIGFGEAAQAFVRGWRSEGLDLPIVAYDLLLDDGATAAIKRAECAVLEVRPAASASDAASGADIIISAVTADQVGEAARSILPAVRPGHFFLDINSAAPFRKAAAAETVAAHAAQVVDVAVMSPVHPKLHKTPLLLSGPGASAIAPFLSDLKMNIEVVSDQLGDASTVKMVRSIAIKGFESVITECVVAAVKLGVADRVLPTIGDYLAGKDFLTLANHVMERVAVHGRRRAAEMREVVATLEEAGLTRHMPTGTATHQQGIADLDLAGHFGGKVPGDHRAIADAILKLQ